MEAGLRTCLLSVRRGEALALDEHELRRAYYVSPLRFVGCTAQPGVL